MRGPREHRSPYEGFWHPYASQGWRIFEFLHLCEEMAVQAIVTLSSAEEATDLADLMEYAFGNSSTTWGSLRVQDRAHPSPYQPFVIEIGNEMDLNAELTKAVTVGSKAMLARAAAVGLDPARLHFAIGHNLEIDDMDTEAFEEMVNATHFLGDQLSWDLHVGGDAPGMVDDWARAFKLADEKLSVLGSAMRLA
eukprot:1914073-Amphidinium_carterae.1